MFLTYFSDLPCIIFHVDTVLTLSQFAQRVDKSEMYIRQLASKGRIGQKNAEGRWIFGDADVARMLPGAATTSPKEDTPETFGLPPGRVATMYVPYSMVGTVSTLLRQLGIYFVPKEYFTLHEAKAWQEGLEMLRRKGQTFDKLHSKWFSDIYNQDPKTWCERWYDFLEHKYGASNPQQEGTPSGPI